MLLVSACSTNPATGQRQFTGLLSDDGAESLGRQEHPNILKQFDGIYNEQGMTDYINEIGQKIAVVSDMPEEDFKFVVLNQNMVNAFAMPGGYIYIGRGIIELANDESELAGVLAHEIGHVTARHANSRYSNNMAFDIGEVLLGEFVGYGTDKLLDIGSGLYLMSYSREQEYQSDLLSVRYLAKAGYDSEGMYRFLAQLRRNGILAAKLSDEDISKVDSISYFDTHPQTLERMERAKMLAWQEKSGVSKQSEYFNKIDGLLYGQRSEQGFVRGQTFAHPDIDVVFSMPEGYDIKNMNDKLLGIKDKGQITFTIDGSQGITNPKDYMYDIWLSKINHNGSELPKATKVNGLNGSEISIHYDGKEITLMAFYHPTKKTYLKFAFIGASDEEVKSTKESIHRMTPEERDLYRLYKIKIITVKSGDSISSLAQLMPFEDFKQERFMVLNGLDDGNIIKIGQKLKIVE